MKISIIIPVYNVAQYLRQCLDSVLSQSYNNIEIILVNDGSTDDSLSICEEYLQKDERILLLNKANGGLSDARNFGLPKATGDYIWFVDSDDWIVSNAIEILVANLSKLECEVLGFSFINYFEDTNKFSEIAYSQSIALTTGNDYILKSTFFFPSAWSHIYSRAFLEKHQLTFKVNQLHEDDYFNFGCFGRITSIAKIKDGLYYYRRRENSITTLASKENLIKRMNSYVALLQLFETLKDIDQSFLLKKGNAYKRNLYELLNQYVLLKTTTFTEKYSQVRALKPWLKDFQSEGTQFNHSKKNWLIKSSLQLNSFLFLITLSLLKPNK
ncbi:glycosyltransferase family 2 protein [Flavobacterium koreense]